MFTLNAMIRGLAGGNCSIADSSNGSFENAQTELQCILLPERLLSKKIVAAPAAAPKPSG